MSQTWGQGNDKNLPMSLGLPAAASTLVIGYGNELRGDDALGSQIARDVAAWELPEVRGLAVQQLTPELAADLAHVRYALFVDAYHTDATEATVYLRLITPHHQQQLAGHTADPGALLALTTAVYGRYPRAWLIAVPATSFAYDTTLSPVAKAGVAGALDLIRCLITALKGEPCTRMAPEVT